MNDSPFPQLSELSDSSDRQVQFFLAEYDRLKGLEVSNWETYYTRFNSFMTVALAAVAAFITLVSADKPLLSTSFPALDMLLVAILVWGAFTFMGLVELNYGTKHLVNAMEYIREYFLSYQQESIRYMYYRDERLYKTPNRVSRIASRWIFGGSPKGVLTILNASLVAYLVLRISTFLYALPWLVITASVVSFSLAVLVHVLFVRWAYQREYLTPGFEQSDRTLHKGLGKEIEGEAFDS